MRLGTKIQAGALQFVLFIGVLIAILLLTFVTLGYTHTFFGKKTTLLVHTVQKAELALEYAMHKDLAANDTLLLNLGIEDGITIKVLKEFWGVFEKYAVVASTKKNSLVKLALVGGKHKEGVSALYLKDNERPMVIVGSAKITGDVYLPQKGIRTGNISGNSYYQKTLVYGKQFESSSELPLMAKEVKEYLAHLNDVGFTGLPERIINLSKNETFTNSFGQPTNYIYGDIINLSGLQLTGNILVKASQKIIVDRRSILQDILLVAPEIIIEDNVKGTFQAIASKAINVGRNCVLNYPSALVVHDKENTPMTSRNTNQEPNIVVGENTIIKGVVQYLGEAVEPLFYPQIKIEEGAKIIGEVYCEQNIELKGQVEGNVTVNSFVAMEGGSIYQNHLFNGTINSELLPKQYVGLALEGTNNAKSVSKWLY